MADPVLRPLNWNRRFHTYAEQHGMFDVIQDLLKELVVWKPEDPLMYIRDEISRISKSVYTPKVFFCGPSHLAIDIGDSIARACGAKFLTLEEIIESSPHGIREHLSSYIQGQENDDEPVRKLLIATISRRLSMEDCVNSGYILYGFPQTRSQAMCAQMGGLLPRQVFMMLPEGVTEESSPAQTSTGAQNEIYSLGKPKSQVAIQDIEAHKDYFIMKETLAAFNTENSKVINYRRWVTTKPSDLEAEFLGALISRKNRGAPWIPYVILIGPPATGKSSIAEYISVKFNLINIDWMDLIRGAALWPDEAADDARQYMEDFSPMSEQSIRTILKRNLGRDDCVKKGWVLHGFPETSAHARIMEELGMAGNRVFLLSCTDAVSLARMDKKRQIIMDRRVPSLFDGSISRTLISPVTRSDDRDEPNIGNFPYSQYAVQTRLENFNANLEDIMSHYGSFMIFVDAGQSPGAVCDFVSGAIVRPPNIRF